MGSVSAQLIDELGYDPDDGVPQLVELGDLPEALCPRESHGGARGAGGAAKGRALARGAMIAARIGARRVAVARLGSGRLVVVADECPHDGGRISDGFVDGERLVCARHGWELEARNGRCERVCKPRE
ncbi:MAG: Rieske 2Fe-2S domain-containing protein [Deltaproteobacteria bacterium]|nr:MAG: Rieske 2Fe-2S domain-containing protein [Deltaproteobacteria bacterium]TMQ22797.1 MAG: Rieske 2Fe-2S domain-containing protein [Deltaproteobacteria bacterium]